MLRGENYVGIFLFILTLQVMQDQRRIYNFLFNFRGGEEVDINFLKIQYPFMARLGQLFFVRFCINKYRSIWFLKMKLSVKTIILSIIGEILW